MNHTNFTNIFISNFLNDDQLNTLKILKNTCSSLSFVGSIVMMILNIGLRIKFRSIPNKQLFFTTNIEQTIQEERLKYKNYKMVLCQNLIFYIAVSNFFNNITMFFDVTFSNGKIINSQSCMAQAIMSNFFELAGLCCVSLMALTLLLAICNIEIDSVKYFNVYFFVYIIGLPLLFTIG